jgi:hypothetical protein
MTPIDSGGAVGTRSITITGSVIPYGGLGVYSSGNFWSLVSQAGEFFEITGVSGSTYSFKEPIGIQITDIWYAQMNVKSLGQILKIYPTSIKETYGTEYSTGQESQDIEDIGVHLIKILGVSSTASKGKITINGTTLTDGTEFTTTGKALTAAASAIATAINTYIPDVTATVATGGIISKTIKLSGLIKSVTILSPTQTGVLTLFPIKLWSYSTVRPKVYLDSDVGVYKKLSVSGHLLSDDQNTAENYVAALWNCAASGWVQVFHGLDDFKWYAIEKANVSLDCANSIMSKHSTPHRLFVYNWRKFSNGDTIKVNAVTLTSGTTFTPATSNDNTTSLIAAAISAGVSGVTATANGNEILLSGAITQLVSNNYRACKVQEGCPDGSITYKYAINIDLRYAPHKLEVDDAEYTG